MNIPPPPHDGPSLRISVEIDPLRPARVLERAWKRFPQAGQRINKYLQEGPCTCGECKPWPKWCLLPASCFGHIVTDELQGKEGLENIYYYMIELATLATWRYSQGIYLFHTSVLSEIIEAPFVGVLPAERFHHLPQWCVYADTPNMTWFGDQLVGFWAHLAWDSIREAEVLVFLLDKGGGLEMRVLEIGPWSVREGIQRLVDFAREQCLQNNLSTDELKDDAEEIATALAPLVSMLLVLCSDAAEIEHEHIPGLRPANPLPKKTRHGLKLFAPVQPTYWRVGKTSGALLG
ncbi:MAG: hypothetical protein FWG26_08695 [Betaproteobacteria bacterium]|nr:hypothetical protein [Betaproteobacteria bacterium]